jgi:hypothetical protein
MTFWTDAIKKDMEKVSIAFDFIKDWTPEQVRQGAAKGDFVGFQEIDCHIVFDVKMDLTPLWLVAIQRKRRQASHIPV